MCSLKAHEWAKSAERYPTKYEVEAFHDYVSNIYVRIRPFQMLSITTCMANAVVSINLTFNTPVDTSLALIAAMLNASMIMCMAHSYQVRHAITRFISSVETEQHFAKMKREGKDVE